MTPRDALCVGVRVIGFYWISCGVVDFVIGAIRGTGVNLGAGSLARDLIFGAINLVVGLSFAASASQIASLIPPEKDLHRD